MSSVCGIGSLRVLSLVAWWFASGIGNLRMSFMLLWWFVSMTVVSMHACVCMYMVGGYMCMCAG